MLIIMHEAAKKNTYRHTKHCHILFVETQHIGLQPTRY